MPPCGRRSPGPWRPACPPWPNVGGFLYLGQSLADEAGRSWAHGGGYCRDRAAGQRGWCGSATPPSPHGRTACCSAKGNRCRCMSSIIGTAPPAATPLRPISRMGAAGTAALPPRAFMRLFPISILRAVPHWPDGLQPLRPHTERNRAMKRFDTIEQLCRAAGAPADDTARAQAHSRWQSLAHPLGSLGLLETMLEDAAALTGSPRLDFSRRAVLVFCADNGVVAQGGHPDRPRSHRRCGPGPGRRAEPCLPDGRRSPLRGGAGGHGHFGFCRRAGGAQPPGGQRHRRHHPGPRHDRRAGASGDPDRGGAGGRAGRRRGPRLLATGEMGIGNTTTSRRWPAPCWTVRPGSSPAGGRGCPMRAWPGRWPR